MKDGGEAMSQRMDMQTLPLLFILSQARDAHQLLFQNNLFRSFHI